MKQAKGFHLNRYVDETVSFNSLRLSTTDICFTAIVLADRPTAHSAHSV